MSVLAPSVQADEAPLTRTLVLAASLAWIGLSLAALWLLPLLYLAPNRLVTGTPIMTATALGPLAFPVAGLGAAAILGLGLTRGRAMAVAAILALAGALLLLAWATGQAADQLIEGRPPATRARLASGFWLCCALLGAGLVMAIFRARMRWAGAVVGAVLLLALTALAHAGSFDGLSLAVELRARRGALTSALLVHVSLCVAALALAIAAVLGLALMPRLRKAIDLALSGIQVVPAIALFGGLVALLSALLAAMPSLRAFGLGALGTTPTVIAVAAYLTLPLWRGLHAALGAPEPSVLAAGEALGLTPRQQLFGIKLPLGAPILVGALRVATVQSIGLTTLGALVGAGGLGAVLFEGMAQFAADLILLGAIPIVVVSLAADQGLGLIENAARAQWHS